MNFELTRMKEKLEKLKIDSYFTKIHHFSSNKFSSNPPELSKHYNYCISKEIKSENLQTTKRALKVCELYENGLNVENAINQSWKEYPVLRE